MVKRYLRVMTGFGAILLWTLLAAVGLLVSLYLVLHYETKFYYIDKISAFIGVCWLLNRTHVKGTDKIAAWAFNVNKGYLT